MPHQHSRTIKSLSPTSKPKAFLFDKEHRHHCLIRSLPLLLLTFYTAICILKLAPPPPPPPPPSTTLQQNQSSDSWKHLKETASSSTKINDVESLKTHVSSNGHHHLRAHEESDTSVTPIPCSALIDGRRSSNDQGFICCDRSNYRTDVCYMKGDIRTSPGSSTIVLHKAREVKAAPSQERIRPYTRKWETGVMDTIDEVTLRPAGRNDTGSCDVRHDGVPALVFSAGGYTGNVYHEFNDGLIPLFITAGRFEGEVVLVVLEYHSWWYNKYRSVLKRLTKFRVIDLAADRRVHCFGEMIVGLKIHGELSVDPQLMSDGKGIRDFQVLLARGLTVPHPPPPTAAIQTHGPFGDAANPKPTIVIFIRHKSRVLYNLKDIIRACQRIGFNVQTLDPKRTTPLSEIHAALSSSDAMLAVHGAAVTHFLFMQPSAAMIQIVPLGLDWAAETYYGEPARKLGQDYVAYRVSPEESSLLRVYGRKDPVIVDPRAITGKGWSETKKVYLDRQNIRVNIKRFSKVLEKIHGRICKRMHANV